MKRKPKKIKLYRTEQQINRWLDRELGQPSRRVWIHIGSGAELKKWTLEDFLFNVLQPKPWELKIID